MPDDNGESHPPSEQSEQKQQQQGPQKQYVLGSDMELEFIADLDALIDSYADKKAPLTSIVAAIEIRLLGLKTGIAGGLMQMAMARRKENQSLVRPATMVPRIVDRGPRSMRGLHQ